MITVEKREQIRQAYFLEHKSIRRIAREIGCSRDTVNKAIVSAEPGAYTLKALREAPVLGPYKVQIDQLLADNEHLPRKQRYTSHKIYETLRANGYHGSESNIRRYIGKRRQERRRPKVYLPLEFDPGQDAQVDWGEAVAIIGGEKVTVQVFYMRLNYSRKLFMRAYPAQNQESFFEGHVWAFRHFEGVPQRISYDNLKAAVHKILQGSSRLEQQAFIVFRSHYLFESHFCTPGKGNQKGGVEHGVGFGRRNFMVPLPDVASFEELNALLLKECLADDQRKVDGQEVIIGQAWELEKPHLRRRPEHDCECCVSRPVVLNPYSQVEFGSNRYSVPVDRAQPNLAVKAYPFRIDVLHLKEVIASHARCYGHNQDFLDPLHYLSLLEKRPGAFPHAKPIRRWRETWPAVFDELLSALKKQWPDGQGVREFIAILKLCVEHPVPLVEQAVQQALAYGCAHADGVELCLRQLSNPPRPISALDLGDHPAWASVGAQAPNLRCYDQLLAKV